MSIRMAVGEVEVVDIHNRLAVEVVVRSSEEVC